MDYAMFFHIKNMCFQWYIRFQGLEDVFLNPMPGSLGVVALDPQRKAVSIIVNEAREEPCGQFFLNG